MRQTSLLEFGLKITTIYVPIRNYPYMTRRGLSELQLRRRLEKQGWQVWRGGFLHAASGYFPSVKKKYDFLFGLLKELTNEDTVQRLCYLSSVHHGMPDFLCYNSATKQFKFVECKLGHEALSQRQVVTISKLHDAGFVTEVHKLVDACTKTRRAVVNISLGTKQVMEKEMTLKTRW
ncbi:MAG: VRR-NUC domain-containing protein [Nanoarchaeota archaeon]